MVLHRPVETTRPTRSFNLGGKISDALHLLMRAWVRPHFLGWHLVDALYYAVHVCLRDSGGPVHGRRSVFLLPFLNLVFPLRSEASYDRKTLVVQEENRAGLWSIQALDHTRNCSERCGARRIRNIEDLVIRFSRWRNSGIRGDQQQGARAVRLHAGRVQVLWFAFQHWLFVVLETNNRKSRVIAV